GGTPTHQGYAGDCRPLAWHRMTPADPRTIARVGAALIALGALAVGNRSEAEPGGQQQQLLKRLQAPTPSSPADHVGVPLESLMATQPATQAQLDYIQRLCRKLGLSHDQAAAAGVGDALSIDAASATIDRL